MAHPKPDPGQGNGSPGGEDAALQRIRRSLAGLQGPSPPGEIRAGDDAAVVVPPAGPLLLSVDTMVEGVHFTRRHLSLADVGWKALTTAVSDIGAMGGRPGHALAAVCVPPDADLDQVVVGLGEAATRWGCPVVGGDLTEAPVLVLSISVTGSTEGVERPVTRSGASPGDVLFVTGPLGASAAGVRQLQEGVADEGSPLVAAHRRPEARLAEGWQARLAGATAMMDISDGFSLDLHRLAEASGVGVVVEEVPVAAGASFEEALGGGEDYELIVATPDPAALLERFRSAGLRPPIEIGRCTDQTLERRLRDGVLPRSGWQHRISIHK